MELFSVLNNPFSGIASLVAFQKLYVYKDYPRMDPYQQYVMEAVYQNPEIPVAVHLKWFDGSTSIQEYTYHPNRKVISIQSDTSFLFSSTIPEGPIHKKWQDWIKQPEILLRWQLWPAKIYRIRVLTTPATMVLADDAIREAKEPEFSCQNSEILRQTCQLQKVRNEHLPANDFIDIDYAKRRYELFLRTIAWGIYQRLKESQRNNNNTLVMFVKQLFFYLRAQNVDYHLTTHFWLATFSGPNGVPRHLNCLGITSLLCAIMECFGYFPETLACRMVQGHAMLVYRVNERQPWQDLELSVPNDKTINWLGICEWFNYGNRQNYVIQSAPDLITAMAYNCLGDLSSRWQFSEAAIINLSQYRKKLLKFLIPENATIHQKVAARNALQEGDISCAPGRLTSQEYAEFLADFLQRSKEYLPSYVLGMFLCKDLWNYIKEHLTEAEIKDVYAKLRQNEHFTSAKYLWQIPNPLHGLMPKTPQSISLMAAWRSHLSPQQLEQIQQGWAIMWGVAREVMEEPAAKVKVLKKRTATEAATGTSPASKYPRLEEA